MQIFRHWRIERDEKDGNNLVWLVLDRADSSTNTLSGEVLTEFDAILDEIAALVPRALIIRSGKDSGFIAGADIEEFTGIKSREDAFAMIRRGWDPFNKLEGLPFPTVALIDGFCMGGGMELALACRYRVAVDQPGTRLALPEVMLGIWPLMGGVMRLTRYVAPPQALDMMLTGRAIDARRARRMGLVDEAVPPRIKINTARALALNPPAPRRPPLLARLMNLPKVRPLIAAQAEKQVAKRARREHYPAPYAILRAWSKYGGDPFAIPDDDPASIAHLLNHPTAGNLIRVFFLQERMKALGKASDFRAKHVHVVGAGIMGGDIAAWCASRGLTVTLQDQNAERLAPAMKRAAELFARRLREPRRMRDAMDRLIPDVGGDGARHADLIIEAIFENLEAKRTLFARLEAMAKPGAVLASNTSSLKLADIGANFADPTRLVGIHFFNPVAQMQLVEVVSGVNTDTAIAEKAAAFVRQIDKLPLHVKDSPGFLVNRVLGPYMQNAFRMVDASIAPETLDRAMEEFGMPMGPIELADVVGLDICMAVGKELGSGEPPRRLKELFEAKHLGKKTGQGFYRWKNGKPQKGQAGTVTADLIEKLIAPYLKEAQAAVAEGIVADADLADAGLIFGTGFAPFRGGPLHYLGNKGKLMAPDTAASGNLEYDTSDHLYREVNGIRLEGTLHRPSVNTPCPLVLEVHGGAWRGNDRRTNGAIHSFLASSGIAVFAIDFRTSKVAPYPAALQDINHAMGWVMDNAERLGSRRELVGGVGTSSGGHELMLSVLRSQSGVYMDRRDVRLAYAVACWPVLDPRARYDFARDQGKQRLVDAHHAFWRDEAQMEDASPLRILRRGEAVCLPPALLLQGTADSNFDYHNTVDFADAYRRAGGEVELELYEGAPHNFIKPEKQSPAATLALERMREFIFRRCVTAKI